MFRDPHGSAAGLGDDAKAANIKLRRLKTKYKEFSEAAGLPQQKERMKVVYSDDNASKEVTARLREQRAAEEPIRADIKSGKYPLALNREKQARHMAGTETAGRSVVTISEEELQELINAKAGSGKIIFRKEKLAWKKQEIIDAEKEIGYTVDKYGAKIYASSLKIHYSKTGTHAVPRSKEWEK